MRVVVGALLLAVLAPALAAGVASRAQAQNEGMGILKDPTEDKILAGLEHEVRTRGIGGNRRPTIRLHVEFVTNSAKLRPDGERVLTMVGHALQKPGLKADRFLITAHTEASGSDDFDRHLSEQRAAAVKDFLVGTVHVDAGRLDVSGVGSSKPLAGAAASDPENRRIEFVNLRGPA
jgi:outer membrane protein OmpA-like peptidoglycan-associated protein